MLNISALPTKLPFENLPFDVMQKIAEHTKLSYYKKGTLIFNAYEANLHFIYLNKGWVKLFRNSNDGAEIIVDILHDNHYAGENFIFDKTTLLYEAEALSDIECLLIPIDCLKQIIKENHQFSLNLLTLSLQKQQKLTLEVEHLTIKNATERMGCFLLRLCTLKKSNDITIQLPYDKSLLASRLGMRAETFSRALNKICHACDIHINGDILHIQTLDKLIAFVCQKCSQTFPCRELMQ